MQAIELMNQVIERGGSDLHLNPGRPPVIRVHGNLVSLPGAEVLTDDAVEVLCRSMTSAAPSGVKPMFQPLSGLLMAVTSR